LLKCYKVDDKIYFQESEKGLYELKSGKPVLICNQKILLDNIVVGIFKVNGRLLILTDKSGFYFLDKNNLTKWKIEGEKNFENYKIYNSIRLSDGSFALGSISNGFTLIDKYGNTIIELNKSNGISNNTILNLFEDNDKNLWLGLQTGINCINLKSPILEYNDNQGKVGGVCSSATVGNYFYLGTNHGLFYKDINKNQDFKMISGTEGQVWNLSKINDELFCGHDTGTFFVKNTKAFKIGQTPGSWMFKKHPKFDNLILQGNYNGIHILQKEYGKWKYKNKLEGFDISSRYFEIVNDTTLLVSHEYKGVFKITFNNELDKIHKIQMDPSVKKGINASLIKFDEEIFYLNSEGLFRFDKNRLAFQKDETLSKKINFEDYLTGKMINDNNGRLWIFSNNRINYLQRELFSDNLKFESFFFQNNSRKNALGWEHVNKYVDSKYIFGSGTGYLLVDLDKIKSNKPQISIHKIIVKDNVQNFSQVSASNNLELDFEKNSIQFYYTANNYQKYEKVKYQYILEGYDMGWSLWNETTDVSFSNLPSGNYKFAVRSKIGNEISDITEWFEFKIKPPWYRSNLMYIIYAISMVSIFILINKIYNNYYELERKKLIKINKRKLQINDLASQKELMKIRNEKLQNDIENKNREIAIATMSTVKRNEFLNKIKNELKNLENQPKIDRLIKLINKNLKKNEDWEFFEKAFNNADKDFLTKLKDLHPSLTHNDLRLCAFLRLNLLSKEIAPLLNISVRSVEVKRYRLRKKLNMNRDESISDYFMNL
jgi:DNA-binding CsgD family transcriptional regulator